jgi:DNA-binding response OmpR family regulator
MHVTAVSALSPSIQAANGGAPHTSATTSQGRILLVSDEEAFASATAELLRAEGFEVEVDRDGASATARIAATPCDLVISDLDAPGNADLALVREVARRTGGVPVIVVTASPRVETAVAAVGLRVSAFLPKPVNQDELRAAVLSGISRYRSWQLMRGMEKRLEHFQRDMARLTAPHQNQCGTPLSVDAFLSLTLRNVMGSLADLEHLSHALSGGAVRPHPCQVMNCPRGMQLREAITDAIAALEETKASFKSKTLATLRQKLERVLQES